ncbi:amidohydrolase [Streptomyces boncukensis]|uniref:amidohydrolase n=1 Tax=Streptomyces boncukensis TaxID=2711219 RepID=UPI0019CF5F77|nr:amidohydrolase [Streptomyces boncukensis]
MLVDQHSHGVLHTELGLATFEARLAAEAGAGAPYRGTFYEGSFYDSGPGLAVRRWCPPLLGLEPHCPPARYLARRREMGAYAAARALLHGSGIGCFLVDTSPAGASDTPENPGGGVGGPDGHGGPGGPGGHGALRPEAGEALMAGACEGPAAPYGLTSPGELAAASGGRVREAVGLEALAAQIADTSGSVRAFVTNTAEALHTAARGTVAFISGAGFHEAEPPGLGEVLSAAARWLRHRAEASVQPLRRIAGLALHHEPVLVRHLLWSALTTGRPLQLRCGDPAPLEGFLGATTGRGTALVLLARPPHHRAAARLAAAFPHVYADAGPSPAETLAEAPFGKLLFATRARALPELYVTRARGFTAALGRVLAEWVEEGVCARADASRIAARIACGNASRVYGLGVGEGEGAGR